MDAEKYTNYCICMTPKYSNISPGFAPGPCYNFVYVYVCLKSPLKAHTNNVLTFFQLHWKLLMEVCAPLSAQKPPGKLIAKLTEPEERRLSAPAGDLGLRKWITFMGVEGCVSLPLTLTFHIKSLTKKPYPSRGWNLKEGRNEVQLSLTLTLFKI